MSAKPTPAVVEAWANLVRTERTLLDKVEEDLKRAHLPPLDWYHVLHEIDRSPKGMLRQTGVQDRTQLAQYNVCRLVDRLESETHGALRRIDVSDEGLILPPLLFVGRHRVPREVCDAAPVGRPLVATDAFRRIRECLGFTAGRVDNIHLRRRTVESKK